MSNKSNVVSLVAKHFSLNPESLKRFKENIENPFVDPIYQSLGLDNLRKKIKLSPSDYVKYDNGWAKFKILFPEFCNKTLISYEDFHSGLYKGRKLFREIISFYNKKDPLEQVKIKVNLIKIGEYKLPKVKDLYLVLSLNFVDWFLCSTAENWHSCLNLNSDYQSAFWSGLPGLIIDKNRAMIYLTDGEEKEYRGIKTDRLISRTWGILSEYDSINTIKEYPINIISNTLLVDNFKNIKEINKSFKSKHPIDFLFNKSGYSIFPYLDKSKLDKDHFIIGTDGHGGLFGIDIKGNPYDGTPYNCEYGLDHLIKRNQEINDYCGEQYSCCECGIGLIEDEVYYDEGFVDQYCESCFQELKKT